MELKWCENEEESSVCNCRKRRWNEGMSGITETSLWNNPASSFIVEKMRFSMFGSLLMLQVSSPG